MKLFLALLFFGVSPLKAAGLDQAFPKMISPNGDQINDQAFFYIHNPSAAIVEGKVFDLRGRQVADLLPSSLIEVSKTILVWNGREKDGSIAAAGIYIFRIQVDNQAFTGTIVVVK